MRLLTQFNTRPKIYAAVDVSSHAIRGVVFVVPEAGKFPQIIKKAVVKFPESWRLEKSGHRLHEFLFSLVKNLEKVPDQILISLSPNAGDYTLASWKAVGSKIATAGDLRKQFRDLFEVNREADKALLAYPVEILANGYSVRQALAGVSGRNKEWYRQLAGAQEVVFKTVLVSLPNEVGADLQDTKESLGGLPIEFVPRLATYKEAITKAMQLPDLFLVEIGGEETTLVLLKKGELAGTESFPVGARNFFRDIANEFNITFEAAEDLKRQYTQGLLAEPNRSRLQNFMLQAVGKWEKLFQEKLQTFYTLGPIPAQLALTGEGARMPEIVNVVKNPAWCNDFSYTETPKIRALEAENIFAGDTLGGLLREPQEFALASLIFYALNHKPMF